MKKLNLKELELKLPKIDENYSKILLGGDSYGLDDCAISCGEDPNNPKNLVDASAGGPLDYDNSYDLDISFDGINNYDGYQDEGQTQGNDNSNTPNLITLPQSLSDGVDLNNFNIDLDLSNGNELFNSQLNGILTNNSVIGNLISLATQDYMLRFEIGQLQPGSNSTTSTEWGITNADSLPALGFQTIILDIDLVTALGTLDVNTIDNTQLNHNNLTPLESLVAIIAHESFHAYTNIGYYNSRLNGNTPEESMNWMLANGFSQEIVDIYYSTITNANGLTEVVINTGNFAQNEHDYMASDSFTFVNDAIAEFQADQAQVVEIKNNMEAWVQELQNNAQQYGDESADGGTNWISLYIQQQDILTSFIENYGWMIP